MRPIARTAPVMRAIGDAGVIVAVAVGLVWPQHVTAAGRAAIPACVAPVEDEHVREDADVRLRAKAAAARIAQGELDAAEVLIAADIAQHPDPFVFLEGILRERQGDCGAAVAAFRRYIALGVPAVDAEAARAGIDRCELAEGPSDADDTVGAPAGEPRSSEPSAGEVGATVLPGDTGARNVWTDPAGLALGIGGLTVAATGAIVWSRVGAARRAVDDAAVLTEYEDSQRRGQRLQIAGITLVAVGAALVVGSVVRYSVVARRRRRSTASVAWRPAAGGFVIVF